MAAHVSGLILDFLDLVLRFASLILRLQDLRLSRAHLIAGFFQLILSGPGLVL